MDVKNVAAFAIFLQLCRFASCDIVHIKYANLKGINWGLPLAGYRLNVTPIASVKVSNRIACMAQCVKTKGCVATNFGAEQAGDHECELLDTTRYSNVVNEMVEGAWTYTGPKTICEKNPCASGTFCVAGETAKDYTCIDVIKVATCQDYQDLGFTKSGIYKLAKANGELFEVYCDLEDDGGGWIVFVRYDGTGNEMFDQDWATYRDGFGDLNSNFWWGNEFLYLISNNKPQELKVDLVKSTATAYGKYQQFKVASEADGYRLTFNVPSFTGNVTASLNSNNDNKFSTPDKDQDKAQEANCAAERRIGWWYNYCTYANPAKLYWSNWNPQFIQLKIRPMKD